VWIDLVLARWPIVAAAVPVRGVGVEILMLAASFVAGLLWLYARFVLEFQPPPGPLRLLWLALLIGSAFNALPAIFLLARRYKLRDLGFRVAGLRAVPLVIATFAGAALLLSPARTTWQLTMKETGGSVGALVLTALSASVPEEFFRFVWQTRVGAWLQNPAAGWLVASLLWATLHAPKDWSDTHSLMSTIMSVVNIVPLGLLWGYLTHRSRSMLPSIVLHGTNLWGLQNLL
jgi:membrane protease YdiL (CAAX protease family)